MRNCPNTPYPFLIQQGTDSNSKKGKVGSSVYVMLFKGLLSFLLSFPFAILYVYVPILFLKASLKVPHPF